MASRPQAEKTALDGTPIYNPLRLLDPPRGIQYKILEYVAGNTLAVGVSGGYLGDGTSKRDNPRHPTITTFTTYTTFTTFTTFITFTFFTTTASITGTFS